MLGLALGNDPLWLRPQLSHVQAQLIVERQPDRVPAGSVPNPYLVPGAHPGQPITAESLGRRLQALGITKARLARNGAQLAMVGSIHWTLLADLMGISHSTAQRWHLAAGADRASYVASRLRQHAAPTGRA
jgi:hypothetical protein